MESERANPADADFHKRMAVAFFNETWTLLEKATRTPEEDARMIHLAHASRAHWEFVGTPENLAVGEWQISRVHAVLRQPESALYHAGRSLELAVRSGLSAFHRACGHEAMARALSLAHSTKVAEHLALARSIALEITDLDDRKIVEDDLAGIAGS